MSAQLIEIGPHDKMTPEQALAFASREDWEHVIIMGFHKDSEAVCIRSSHMAREFALWIVEHAKRYVLDTPS